MPHDLIARTRAACRPSPAPQPPTLARPAAAPAMAHGAPFAGRTQSVTFSAASIASPSSAASGSRRRLASPPPPRRASSSGTDNSSSGAWPSYAPSAPGALEPPSLSPAHRRRAERGAQLYLAEADASHSMVVAPYSLLLATGMLVEAAQGATARELMAFNGGVAEPGAAELEDLVAQLDASGRGALGAQLEQGADPGADPGVVRPGAAGAAAAGAAPCAVGIAPYARRRGSVDVPPAADRAPLLPLLPPLAPGGVGIAAATELTLVPALPMALEARSSAFVDALGMRHAVRLLAGEGTLLYCRGRGHRAVGLPLHGGALRLELVLPEHTLRNSPLLGDSEALAAPLAGATARRVFVRLPAFAICHQLDATETLRHTGLARAMGEHAELRPPMAARPADQGAAAPAFLERAMQRASVRLQVDAAAGGAPVHTGHPLARVPARGSALRLTFGRPFVFVVRHVASQEALLMGHVADVAALQHCVDRNVDGPGAERRARSPAGGQPAAAA